jgi:hypothetical protein
VIFKTVHRHPSVLTAFSVASIVICASLTLVVATVFGACRRSPYEGAKDFGEMRGAPQDVQAYLALARAIVEKKPESMWPVLPGLHAPPEPRGRRVMLALWQHGEASVATAKGPTLADAVASAAALLATRATVTIDARARLELDIPTGLDAANLDEDIEVPAASIGLEGVLVVGDDGKAGAVLPGEVVQRGYFHSRRLDHAAIAGVLAARAGVQTSELATMRAYRFRADARVESPDHESVLSVWRGRVESPDVTAETLLAAAQQGADYLTRIVNRAGRYVYIYHPVDDRDDASYGWLRHSGTTYALFEAYEEFGTSAYLETGERALRYLRAHLSRDEASQGMYVLDTEDEEQQKVGGAALALLAFAKHAAVIHKKDDPEASETCRALARLIMKKQCEDGHFRSNADIQRETGKKLKREPVYYPGEAVLALVRLYAVDPQPVYLDAARRGADFVVHVRDAYVSEDNQEHDHWMAYALNELYRVTHDDAYLTHAFKIARAIQKKQRTAADVPDMVGAFYEGQTTPTSTRLEAYDADIVLSRFAGRPEPWLIGPARQAARFTLAQQLRSNDDYWLKNPAKAEGGVRESLFVQDVRIDYVQHAMSAWLHLARILRDPDYGKTGVPSQDPVQEHP